MGCIRIGFLVRVACVVTLACASPSSAVIIHAEDEGIHFDPPPSSWVGRWGSKGGCVAIGPNHVVTTLHLGGGAGTSVTIAGKALKVAEVFDDPGADLRIARIATAGGAPANLTKYAPLYTGSDETSINTFALGGRGKVRGEELVSDGCTYGYLWQDNSSQVWGLNRVDTLFVTSYNGETIYRLQADFDGPDDCCKLPREATIADGDSGGGWFGLVNDRYVLIGLSMGATSHPSPQGGQSWFRRPNQPNIPDPDRLYGIRLSDSADWIQQVAPLSTVPTGDTNWDFVVNDLDVTALKQNFGATSATWSQGDFNGDGAVTMHDAWELLRNYDPTQPAGNATTIPEPATAMLLCLLGAAVVRRRR
ncbi:MAG: dockerin type I domain-containing protein [Phycisphaerae bacterium]